MDASLELIETSSAKHFVLPEERVENAVDQIRKELSGRLEQYRSDGRMLEAQRINARTRFDIEMMTEVGYCPGIENYSRILAGRAAGDPPTTRFPTALVWPARPAPPTMAGTAGLPGSAATCWQ